MRKIIVCLAALALAPLVTGCDPDPDPIDQVCDVIATYTTDGIQSLVRGDLQVAPTDVTGDGQVIVCAIVPIA